MESTTFTTPDIQTEKPALKKPPMYKVIMHNDDFTPMDFVVDILIQFFQHNDGSATSIMMSIHQTGIGLCGLYPKDIAESKVAQVENHCREHEYPLRCSFERQSND